MWGKFSAASTLAIAAGLAMTGQAVGKANENEGASQTQPAVDEKGARSNRAKLATGAQIRGRIDPAQVREVGRSRAQRIGTYEVTVPTGSILAAEFDQKSVRYWIINPVTGATTTKQMTINPPPVLVPGSAKGQLTFKLTEAAGIYLTNTTSNTSPQYQVSFTGSAKSDAMASWLLRGSTNERGVFDRLRSANNGSRAAQLHRDRYAPLSVKMQNDVRTEIEGSGGLTDKLTELVTTDMVAAQQRAVQGLKFFYDTNGVDATDLVESNRFLQQADAGSLTMLPWAGQIDDISTRFQARADADVNGLNQISATDIFDPSGLEAAARNCVDFEGFINETTSQLEGLPENGDTDDDKSDLYVGERPSVKNAVSNEEDVSDAMEGSAESLSVRAENCLLNAIGQEPVAPNVPDGLSDYEALAIEADTLGTDREQAALSFVDYLDTFGEYWNGRFVEAEGGRVNGQPARYAPSRWLSGAERITKAAEQFSGVGQASVLVPRGQLNTYAKSISSPTACNNPSWTFNFNVGNLGVVIGTPFNDRVQGNDTANSYEAIFGLGGDDCLNGRDGFELITGNRGNDEIHGGDKIELLTGGEGEDRIYAGHGKDVEITIKAIKLRFYIGSLVSGSAGSDELFGNDPADTPTVSNPLAEGYTNLFFGDGLSGSNASLAGNDTINTQGGISFAFGQKGNDILRAPQGGRIDVLDASSSTGVGAPVLFGSIFAGQSGNDTIEGSPYVDALFGGKGNDTMRGGGFLDFMMGQAGADTMSGDGGIDLMFAGRGDDTMNGNGGSDLMIGWAGNDTINGDGGIIDAMFGGRGADRIDGGAGIDLAHGGRENDTLFGGSELNLLLGANGNDTLQGGGFADIALGQAGSDWVRGGGFVDFLIGNNGYDRIDGEDGTDVLLGMKGNDDLNGNAGIDLIFGMDGHDIARGGADIDLIMGLAGSDCLYGDGGTDIIFGNGGPDYLHGNGGVDVLLGQGGNDELRGGSETDVLLGMAGDDNIYGEAGIDVAIGSSGADLIDGGSDTDIVFAGEGKDRITGGGQFDVAFGGKGDDSIRDFEVVFAGEGNDTAHSTAQADVFAAFGGKGDDTLVGNGAGVVAAFGNDGNDAIHSENGTMAMLALGQSGEDKIRVAGAGGSGKFLLFGNKGDDHIQASLGKSFAFGNRGNDELNAFEDDDDVKDWMFGNRNNDKLWGNSNSDGSKDRLFGGWGSDSKTRGAGPTITPPPPPLVQQANTIASGDASCRVLEKSQRPAPGAGRSGA